MSLKIERPCAIKAAQAIVAASSKAAYSIPEVAELLGISVKTVYNGINAGKIHAVRILGCRRISHDEVRRLANAGTMATAEQIEEYYRDYAHPLLLATLNRDTNGND